MPVYSYEGMTRLGQRSRGSEEAVDPAALAQQLRRQGVLPLHIHEVKAPRKSSARSPRGDLLVSRRRDVNDFFTTFSALLKAGLPLERSLEVGSRGITRADVGEAISAARQRIREGGRMADELAEHPVLFPPVAVGLVRAAESGGYLAEGTSRLAAHLQRESALRARVTSALIYPSLIVMAGAGAMLVLLLFVLPRFAEMLTDAGGALPRSTLLLLTATDLVTRSLPYLLVVGTLAVLAGVAWRRTPAGRLWMDRQLLRLPVLGGLRARHATTRLAHTLGTLLRGGLPLLNALDIAEQTTGDAAFAAVVNEARGAVRRGESFAGALDRGAVFPFGFTRLVEVGEETGQLDEVLERAAELVESELERNLERLVALVEPLMIVFFGGMVGFVALALLQAIYGIHATSF